VRDPSSSSESSNDSEEITSNKSKKSNKQMSEISSDPKQMKSLFKNLKEEIHQLKLENVQIETLKKEIKILK